MKSCRFLWQRRGNSERFERGGRPELLDEEDVKDWLYANGGRLRRPDGKCKENLNDIQDQYIGLVFDPVRALWARSQGDLDAMDEYAKGGRTKKIRTGGYVLKEFQLQWYVEICRVNDP